MTNKVDCKYQQKIKIDYNYRRSNDDKENERRKNRHKSRLMLREEMPMMMHDSCELKSEPMM